MRVIANRLQEGGAAPHRLQKTTNDPGSVEPRRTCTRHHSTRRKAPPKQLSADGDSLWGYHRRSRIGSIPRPVPDRGAWNPARHRSRSGTQDPRRASGKICLEGRITPSLCALRSKAGSPTEAYTAEGARSDLIFASKSFNPPMIQSINHTIFRSPNSSPQRREDTEIHVLPSFPSTGYSRLPHIPFTSANYTLSLEGNSEKHACRFGFPRDESGYTGGARDAPDVVTGCLGFPTD